MKKTNFLLIVFIAIVVTMTSCKKEDSAVTNGREMTITAESSAIDGLEFTWAANDNLGLYVKSATDESQAPFAYESGAGTNEASFTGSLSPANEYVYAIYSKNNDDDFAETSDGDATFTFTLPTNQIQKYKADKSIDQASVRNYAYMYGKSKDVAAANVNTIPISMSHLMTFIDFTVSDIPVGTMIRSLNLTTSTSKFASSATVNLDKNSVTLDKRVNNSTITVTLENGFVVGDDEKLTVRLLMFPEDIAQGTRWDITLNTTMKNYKFTKNFDVAKSYNTGRHTIDLSLLDFETNQLVVGYITSWSDDNEFTHLKTINKKVTWLFVSFAKPNLRYKKGSYDYSNTGLDYQNKNGQSFRDAIRIAKSRGMKVILSVGGETYWGDPNSYDINYVQITDFIKDFEFDGIDWDFEPDGTFANIGTSENVDRFVTMIRETRRLLPKNQGYLVTCAPSGIGALGGLRNDDPESPYRYDQRVALSGDPIGKTGDFTGEQGPNAISLWGHAPTGHMIPVMKEVGTMIDLIAYQGYNIGVGTNRKIMYDAYSYYANKYGFLIAAGMHIPNEPWGPYFIFTDEIIIDISKYVANGGQHDRRGKGDGTMFWNVGVKAGVDLAVLSYDAMNSVN